MFCTNCGTAIEPGQQQCPNCGAPVNNAPQPDQQFTAPQPSYPQPDQQFNNPQPSYQQPVQPVVNNMYFNADNLPSQYRPLGAWAYFGYMILFAIPLVGFILLIVFSLSDSNINRRNFARSYWCAFLLGIIITVILAATGVLSGILSQL